MVKSPSQEAEEHILKGLPHGETPGMGATGPTEETVQPASPVLEKQVEGPVLLMLGRVFSANTEVALFHSLHIMHSPEEELKKKESVIHKTCLLPK